MEGGENIHKDLGESNNRNLQGPYEQARCLTFNLQLANVAQRAQMVAPFQFP